MDEEQLKLLYSDYANQKGFRDYNEFKTLMSDSGNRKLFFNESNKDLKFSDYNEFESLLGIKKKDTATSNVPSGPSASDFIPGSSPSDTKEPNIPFVEQKQVSTTIPNIPLENPAGIHGDDKDIKFWNYLGKRFESGSAQILAATLRTPETLWDVAANAGNLLLQGGDAIANALGVEGEIQKIQTSKEIGEAIGIENKLAKAFEIESKVLDSIDAKYQKPILESIKNRNYKDALISISGNITQSLPFMLGMILPGAAGVSVAKQVAGTTAVMGAQRKQNLIDRDDLSETQKNVNATIYGLAESLDVLLGAGTVGRAIKSIATKEGEKTVKKFGTELMDKVIKDNPYLQPFAEALQEGTTQYIQNVADITLLGEKKNAMDGVADAMIVGGTMGLLGASAINATKVISKISDTKIDSKTMPALTKNELGIMSKAAKDKPTYDAIINEINKRVEFGVLTPEQSQQQVDVLNSVVETINKIPEEFTVEQKNKAIELITEKQELENEASKLDKVFASKNDEKINQINNELQKIAEPNVMTPVKNDEAVAKETEPKKTAGFVGDKSTVEIKLPGEKTTKAKPLKEETKQVDVDLLQKEQAQEGIKEITPQPEVKTNETTAITEVLQTDKYKDFQQGGILFSKFKDKDISDAEQYKDKNGEITDKGIVVIDIFDKKGNETPYGRNVKKLEESGYIEDFGDERNGVRYGLTQKGKEFIDAVNQRIETRKGVKEGTDLFPEEANIPELQKIEPVLTSKEQALKELEDARIAFRKSIGASAGAPLQNLPELINLVKAYIKVGYETAKEVIAQFKKDYPGIQINDKDIEDIFNKEYVIEKNKIKENIPLQESTKDSKIEPTPIEGEHDFLNKEISKQFKESVPSTQSLINKTKEFFTTIKNKISRTYRFLPKNKKFAEAYNAINKFQKASGIANDKSIMNIREILGGLTKEEYNLFAKKLIFDDLKETITINPDYILPFGIKDVAELHAELEHINSYAKDNIKLQEAIKKRKEIYNTLKNEYVSLAKDIGIDASDGFKRKNYFRHQVLLYAEAKYNLSARKRKGTAASKLFKQRGVGGFNINRDYIQAENEVFNKLYLAMEKMKLIKTLYNQYDIVDDLRKQAVKEIGIGASEKEITKWIEENIPDGYVLDTPENMNFFMYESVPANISKDIAVGILDKNGISKDILDKVMAINNKKKIVIPEEIYKTLDDISKITEGNEISKFSYNILKAWKIWTLVNPKSWFKYNIRNTTGDAEAVFLGNRSGFLKMPRAIKELYEAYFLKKQPEGLLKKYVNEGGVQLVSTIQEIGDLNKLKEFRNFYDNKTNLLKRGWEKYWRVANITTNFREQMLRYANFIDFYEKLEAGKPINYAASNKEFIDGLKTNEAKAFRLSNDLLGAYDQIGEAGQNIRKYWIPFFSFPETNMRRQNQLFINAVNNGKDFSGKTINGAKHIAKKFPFIAWRLTKLGIKMAGLWGISQLYNNLFYKDEEDELPQDIKIRPHVILGRNNDGTVRYFSRIGVVGDYLENFGLDAMPNDVDDLLSGKKSIGDIAKDMVSSPVNKIIQGLNPYIKSTTEFMLNKSMFPDFRKPKMIRNHLEQIATNLRLKDEYRAIAGMPTHGYIKSWRKLFWDEIDPKSSAHWDILSLKSEFIRKKYGRTFDGYSINPKSMALYYYKQALSYGDGESAAKYIEKYIELGGTSNDMQQSMKSLSPYYGIKKTDINEFKKFIGEENLDKLTEAEDYYNGILNYSDDINLKEDDITLDELEDIPADDLSIEADGINKLSSDEDIFNMYKNNPERARKIILERTKEKSND